MKVEFERRVEEMKTTMKHNNMSIGYFLASEPAMVEEAMEMARELVLAGKRVEMELVSGTVYVGEVRRIVKPSKK